jgi:hypothetical protein
VTDMRLSVTRHSPGSAGDITTLAMPANGE